ncbi:unnamed protein product [Adineta steineri]|uniref:TIR domain-containing protein n=1 Tax=Adineta steineri TaxID=433720 RepID=A0A818ZAW3_9BILA|nr:unnamed protein product [Adineta steineri]
MAESRKTQRRTTQEAPTSTKTTDLPNDLPTLFSNLRQIILKKAKDDEPIDSTIFQYIELIKNKIRDLTKLTQPTEIFDALQATLKLYINDILSIKNALNILSSSLLQEIFTTLDDAEENLDLAGVFQNNPTYARTVCFRSFELLALSIITDFLNEKCPIELFSHTARILQGIIYRILTTVECIVFKKNELQNFIPNIRLLLEYVDRNKQNVHHSNMPELIKAILNFIWSLVDDTSLVPTLIETNCPEYVLRWISMEDLPLTIQRVCLHIIENLARHEKGVKVLNNANCLAILLNFKKRVLDPNKTNQDDVYPELRLVYCMAVSLLAEPKENREDLDYLRKILDQLMQLAVDAGQSVNYKYGGFHVSEPILVLTKLCVHDEILKYVLNESNVKGMEAKTKIEFFCKLLTKFRGALASDDDLDQLTLIALFNILWSISFHDEYIDELKSYPKFLITVKSLVIDDGANTVEQYIPRPLSSLTKAANGVLWNLDENNPGINKKTRATRSTVDPDTQALNQSGTSRVHRMHVMVSYSHADSDFCHQFVDALQKDKRLDIWVDFAYCHTEDLWEEIGEAIEKADLLLFLMSKDYQDSKSCRQEVMYAKDSLKKRFIPIYVKKEFTATGWLGVRIVGPQYIRFGKKPFDETVNELMKLIFEDKTQQENKPSSTTENKPPSVTETKRPSVTETKPVETTTQQKKPEENNLTKPNENNLTKPDENNLTKLDEKNQPESNAKPLKKPVEKWTKKDITQWFSDNQIDQQLSNIYDFKYGTDLLLYGECLRPDWQIEYNDVKQRYHEKYQKQLYRDQFVPFVRAVNELQTLKPKSKSKSKLCTIS